MIKHKITSNKFWEIVDKEGGLKNLHVFGAYTKIKGSVDWTGEGICEEDDIYTEWGRDGDEEPLVVHRTKGNKELYYQVVKN